MPDREPFSPAERRILEAKADLSRKSIERLLAYRHRPRQDAVPYQFRLLEAELQNIEALGAYVGTVSPAAARELNGHLSSARSGFESVRDSGDEFALQRWLKQELVPLINKSEQAALLVAAALRRTRGTKAGPFAWKHGGR